MSLCDRWVDRSPPLPSLHTIDPPSIYLAVCLGGRGGSSFPGLVCGGGFPFGSGLRELGSHGWSVYPTKRQKTGGHHQENNKEAPKNTRTGLAERRGEGDKEMMVVVVVVANNREQSRRILFAPGEEGGGGGRRQSERRWRIFTSMSWRLGPTKTQRPLGDP